MSYLNNQVGYRDELLMTRSVVKKENYVLLEPDGLVKNAIPGYENCDVTILGSPAMGATFADYLVTAKAGGKNTGIGGEGIESFLYVISGEVTVKNDDQEATLTEGGYIFSPEGNKIAFENKSGADAKLYVYKRRYDRIEGYSAHTVVNNVNDMEWVEYEGMNNCHIKDLLPAAGGENPGAGPAAGAHPLPLPGPQWDAGGEGHRPPPDRHPGGGASQAPPDRLWGPGPL